MSILVALSVLGVLNASIMGHSRTIFAGARNGHAPTVFGMLHVRYLTPWPAIILKVSGSVYFFFHLYSIKLNIELVYSS